MKWNAKLSDGRTVTLEADEQPNEEQVLGALDEYEKSQTKAPQINLKLSPYEQARMEGRTDLGPYSGAVPGSPGYEEKLTEARSTMQAIPAGLETLTSLAGKAAVKLADIPTRLSNRGKPPELQTPTLEEQSPTWRQLPRVEGTDAASGGLNVAIDLINSLVPPFAKPETGLLAPALPGKIPAAVFGGTMVQNLPEEVVRATDVLADPSSTKADKVSAVGNPIVQSFLGALALKHGATAPKDLITPQTQALLPKAAAEAAQAIAQPKESNAIEERKIEESVPTERTGDDARGTPAETGVSGGLSPATGVEEKAQVPLATTKATGKGLAASVRNKWTKATSGETRTTGESGFITLDPLKDLIDKATPYVKSAITLVKEIGKEQANIAKLDDYRKAVLGWSGKLQQSFQEANDAQKEIQSKVTDPLRREAITNWIQAGGDQAVLRQRAAQSNPEFRQGYEAALALSPEELAVANDVKQAYDTLGQRGLGHDVLKSFKDNYVTQIWDLGKGPQFAGSRTLRDKFRFSKASTFPTFFDGEQAGYVPKTKDISKLLPVYLHEMNSVIAARQLVKSLSDGVASDGRPLVVPRGTGRQVTEAEGKSAILVTPKSVKGDTSDYRVIPNQPALHDWTWATKDDAGNPVFLKSDLALHPEAYGKLRNVLGKSAIREWYSTRTSAVAQIPKGLVRGLEEFNSVTKRTMLGLLSPFHQVQEATHAVGHRVNPTFSIPKVDLVNDRAQMDAANHGLMLQPDRASAEQFMEGFRMSGLVSKIPGIGPLADFYSDYLFHQYIPGLKFKTYQDINARNMKVYERELASGEVTESDVKHLSAEQANAAFGHLNYADLARNPTVQHIMRLGFLAPDFFEARGRFTLQAVKGALGGKVGREQAIALATLAVGQAALAYTSAKLTGGDWDRKHPFEFHLGNRRFALRSVPEDIQNLLVNTRTFVHSRLSPIIGKGALQYLSGVDWRGQKISSKETTKELLEQPIPIGIRGFLGLGRQSLSSWEQLASAVGLRISRYSPSTDVHDMAQKWMASNPDPKVQARLRVQQHSVYPESEYKSLRLALADKNIASAKQAYAELLKTKTPEQVRLALAHKAPFTGADASERAFVKSLAPAQRKVYDEAKKERLDVYRRFQQMRAGQ